MHFIPDCIARPDETIDVNVEATRHLLERCRRSSVQRVVFASTAGVYAPTDGPCVEDTTPLRPLEIYGESKLAAEQLMSAFYEDTGISTSVLRMFNAIGRYETNPHVIPHIFESLRTSDVVALGNVAPRRDYIDTRDMAEAVLAASTLDGFNVLNVGTGMAHSVSDIVEFLRRLLGRPIVVTQELSRVRATERMLLVADHEKIRRATGLGTAHSPGGGSGGSGAGIRALSRHVRPRCGPSRPDASARRRRAARPRLDWQQTPLEIRAPRSVRSSRRPTACWQPRPRAIR